MINVFKSNLDQTSFAVMETLSGFNSFPFLSNGFQRLFLKSVERNSLICSDFFFFNLDFPSCF